MKELRGQIVLGIFLVGLSAGLFVLQLRIFDSLRDTFFYLFQDLAFVPIQILLLTVIVDRLLKIRERAALLKKLNMVIGAFFSEAGTQLLRHFLVFDEASESVGEKLLIDTGWTEQQFEMARKEIGSHAARIDFRRGNLRELKDFLMARRGFLLGLLENQNLLEHDTFTELLWAVFHLLEELSFRDDLGRLSQPDGEHIAGDIKRAYVILINEWISYLVHLRREYPYLYSLAARTNPFNLRASPEVK